MSSSLQHLQVSSNHRFLVNADGTPFFWLGDTAWELFHRLNRAEADFYLRDRAAKGFTVIQAVALAELGGLDEPNANGHLPLIDRDPAQPACATDGSDDYWTHVDEIVHRANSLGLVIGFLPTWGSHWHRSPGEGGVFTVENAEQYGEWLGRRYQDAGLVWILGGDRAPENIVHREIIEAMACGLTRGDGGSHLRTFHPNGDNGSARYFHDADWLDFNIRQNGHSARFEGRYEQTGVDYCRKPPKPVIDAEPLYEDIPLDLDLRNRLSTADDIRRALYWNLFSGAFGHTYGHHSIWQMWTTGQTGHLDPNIPWQDALDRPGTSQLLTARRLLESRPFLSRIPRPETVVSAPPDFVATGDAEGTYLFVYAPRSSSFQVKVDTLCGSSIRAWWLDPRSGTAQPFATDPPKDGLHFFHPPDEGSDLDWILVLDDDDAGYGAPGNIT